MVPPCWIIVALPTFCSIRVKRPTSKSRAGLISLTARTTKRRSRRLYLLWRITVAGELFSGSRRTALGSRPIPSRRPLSMRTPKMLSMESFRDTRNLRFTVPVHRIRHPTSGRIHPIIGVPGGHRVPIRAKRSGPNDRIVKAHAIYIRRPGPESAEPLTASEWDQLFKRCVDERRDELLDQIRNIVLGVPPPPQKAEGNEVSPLERWTRRCEDAWKQRIEALPPESPRRLPRGSYTFTYHIDDATRFGLADLLEILREAPRLTGWNTWWVPTHPAIAPHPVDGTIECWIGGDDRNHHEHRDAAHSDFWRISPDGFAFLRRGYQEDGDHAAKDHIAPGTCFDATLPIWRVGEGLLHAAYLAGRLDGTSVSFNAKYTGLRGRELVQWAGPMEHVDWAGGASQDDRITLTTLADVNAVTANLVDIVHQLLSPLHELFDFTRLPVDVVRHELQRLRERS